MSALYNILTHLKEQIENEIKEVASDETYDKHQLLHEQLDYLLSTMYQGEINECLCEYGLDKAFELYTDKYGDFPMSSVRLLYMVLEELFTAESY